MKTIAPARAWLVRPRIWPRKTGATELKTPATAKLPKPAAAPRMKTLRTSGGTLRRWRRSRNAACRCTVSGVTSRPSTAGPNKQRSTMKGRRRGEPKWSASRPARSVPRPRPPRFTTTATKLPSRRLPPDLVRQVPEHEQPGDDAEGVDGEDHRHHQLAERVALLEERVERCRERRPDHRHEERVRDQDEAGVPADDCPHGW